MSQVDALIPDCAEPVITVRAQLRSSRARIRATRWLHPGYGYPISLGLKPALKPPQKKRGGRSLCRPSSSTGRSYFRLVSAVRSAESLTMPAAPHQFEPTPDGLIGVTKVPDDAVMLPRAAKSLVKALQSPFDRLVSE